MKKVRKLFLFMANICSKRFQGQAGRKGFTDIEVPNAL
jgi:hypothetical protein